MIIEHFPVGPLGCNCVIVGDEETKEALVVDPGGEATKIIRRLKHHGLRCTAILHTHTHFDHVGATKELQEATNATTALHEDDLFLYEGLQMQLDTFGVPFRAPQTADIDRFLNDEETVHAGQIEAAVLHTPGHTPGSLCFHFGKVLIAGDTLFRGSVGRTDLWRGDSEQILKSIRRRILTLEDDTEIITGHGLPTTVGDERARNPFLRGL
ncbi:MAG: MBL fold metallo-hydrolase [Myxococcota bacterium]